MAAMEACRVRSLLTPAGLHEDVDLAARLLVEFNSWFLPYTTCMHHHFTEVSQNWRSTSNVFVSA